MPIISPISIECDIVHLEPEFEATGLNPEQFASALPVFPLNIPGVDQQLISKKYQVNQPNSVHARAAYLLNTQGEYINSDLGYLNLKGVNFKMARDILPRFQSATTDVTGLGLDSAVNIEKRFVASRILKQLGFKSEQNVAVFAPKRLPYLGTDDVLRWISQDDYKEIFVSKCYKSYRMEDYFFDHIEKFKNSKIPFAVTARFLPSKTRLAEYIIGSSSEDQKIVEDKVLDAACNLGMLHGVGLLQVNSNCQNFDAFPCPVDLEDTTPCVDIKSLADELVSLRQSIASALYLTGICIDPEKISELGAQMDYTYEVGRKFGELRKSKIDFAKLSEFPKL